MSTQYLLSLLKPYSREYFTLFLKQKSDHLEIFMQINAPIFNTQNIPHILELLQEHFPSVLKTECFNDFNLPFEKEVKNTELGHLFEHILLDALCIEKIKAGSEIAEFNGRTFWDWTKNKAGSFVIKVAMDIDEYIFLPQALKKSINLLELLLQNSAIVQKETNHPTATI